MPIHCTKIKLKEGTDRQAKEWAAELNRRSGEVLEALKAEGVTIETVFLDKQADGYYLIYFMRTDDLAKSQAVTKSSIAPIEAFHKAFKATCWESAEKLEKLIEFEIDGCTNNEN